MELKNNPRLLGCRECAEGKTLDFNFSMALQPIVNTRTQQIFAYEALARGLNNEPAGEVLKHVDDDNRYCFDQTCRVKAIELAAQLSVPTFLSINFMPNAVYRPELCIRTTLAAAEVYGFPIEHIIFLNSRKMRRSTTSPTCVALSSTTSNAASKRPLMISAPVMQA